MLGNVLVCEIAECAPPPTHPPPSKSPQVLTGVDHDYFESVWDGAFAWIVNDVRSSNTIAESNGSLYDSVRLKAAVHLFFSDFEKENVFLFLAENFFSLTVVFIYSYMSVCFRTGCSVQHVSLGNKWICNMYAFSLRVVLDLFSFFWSFISVFSSFFSKWQLSTPNESAVSFMIIFNSKI